MPAAASTDSRWNPDGHVLKEFLRENWNNGQEKSATVIFSIIVSYFIPAFTHFYIY